MSARPLWPTGPSQADAIDGRSAIRQRGQPHRVGDPELGPLIVSRMSMLGWARKLNYERAELQYMALKGKAEAMGYLKSRA